MASKRALKKNINLLTGELLNECFAFSYFHPNTQSKQVTETMWALAHTRNELISRINRKISKEDRNKQSVRSFYKTLKGDVANMPVLMDHFAR
jgi:hypothetical protein